VELVCHLALHYYEVPGGDLSDVQANQTEILYFTKSIDCSNPVPLSM
jgi:hypothetical protein